MIHDALASMDENLNFKQLKQPSQHYENIDNSPLCNENMHIFTPHSPKILTHPPLSSENTPTPLHPHSMALAIADL